MAKIGAKVTRIADNRLDPRCFTFREWEFIAAPTSHGPRYMVHVNGLRAGFIRHTRLGATRKWWTWTLNGPFMPQHLFPDSGRADSLEAATMAFREAFERWLKWALAQDNFVLWQGADSTEDL